MGWSEKLRNEPQYTAMFKQTHNTMFLSFLPSSSLAWCFLVQDDLGLELHFPFLGMWKKSASCCASIKIWSVSPWKGWVGMIRDHPRVVSFSRSTFISPHIPCKIPESLTTFLKCCHQRAQDTCRLQGLTRGPTGISLWITGSGFPMVSHGFPWIPAPKWINPTLNKGPWGALGGYLRLGPFEVMNSLAQLSSKHLSLRQCAMWHPKCSGGEYHVFCLQSHQKLSKRCHNTIDFWIAILLPLIFQLNWAVTSPQRPLVPEVKTSHGPLLWRKSGALPVDIFQLKSPGGQFLCPSPPTALGALRRPCRPGAMLDW